MKRRSNISYFFSEAFRSISQNKKSIASSVIAITVCLLFIGSITIVSNVLMESITKEEEKTEFIAYVDEQYTNEEAYALQSQIEAIKNVQYVEFVSKETAKNEFSKILESDAVKELPSTVFRDRYHIRLKDNSIASETVSFISDIKGIANVSGSTVVSEGLSSIRKGIQTISMCLSVLLLLISFIIVNNTVSATMKHRTDEVRIMRLYGVYGLHIKMPVIIESIVIGVFAFCLWIFAQWGAFEGFNYVMSKNGLSQLLDIHVFSYYMNNLMVTFFIISVLISVAAGIVSNDSYYGVKQNGKKKRGYRYAVKKQNS